MSESERVDYLIRDCMVLTFDREHSVFRCGAVAISGDKIAAAGPSAEISRRCIAEHVIDGHGKLCIPGLINAHSHMAMATMRGITHDVPDVLYDIMWPIETSLREDDIYDLAMLGIVESLRAGTTCLVDHYFFMDEIARACIDAGVRGVLGHTVMSSDGPFVGDLELQEAFAFVEKWRGHTLITPVFAPHAADTVRPEWLREISEEARRLGLGVHLHVAQSQREVDVVESRYGRTPIQHLADNGVLGPSTIAAHCIYVSDDDVGLLAESGTTAVFCPTVHAVSGKVCRAGMLLQRGVRVGLGTDCASNNDDMNMLEELRMAVAVQNAIEGRPGTLTTKQALEMATITNAGAVGMSGKLGALAPGYFADLVLLDVHSARWTPLVDVEANLVYCASERDVNTVFVAGKPVVVEGRVVTVDEDEVVSKGRAACERVFSRAMRAWPGFAHLPRTAFRDQ